MRHFLRLFRPFQASDPEGLQAPSPDRARHSGRPSSVPQRSEKHTYLPADILHPDRAALGIVTADQLLAANNWLVEQALDAFPDKKLIADFDAVLVDFIRRTAEWMGPIPASRSYHHTQRGGLFSHSLYVAVGALNMGMSHNVTQSSAPRNRDADTLAWHLATFVCGMLHDIGKIHTVGRIHAYAVTPDPATAAAFRSAAAPVRSTAWEPSVEGFDAWAGNNAVESWFIDFESVDTYPAEDYTDRYLHVLVPRPILAFIYHSNPVIRQQFEDFIRNPGTPSRTPIFSVVQNADQINVSQSLDPRRKPGSLELGSLILRRFTEFAAEVSWNLPTSPFVFAYVQVKTGDALRFYGLPFFVATPEAIRQFEEYLLSRKTMGVSINARHVTELIFNSLESQGVMHRTVDVVLPAPLRPDDLADCIPASRATVRFAARNARSVVIGNQPEDALLDLPVIPLTIRVPAAVAIDAPTLAFGDTPQSGPTSRMDATIERNGSLAPLNPALKRDNDFLARFSAKETAAPWIPRDMAAPPESNADAPPACAPSLSGKEPAPDAFGTPPSALPAASTAIGTPFVPSPVDADAGKGTCPTGPQWLDLFRRLERNPDLPEEEAWAAVWLYVAHNPSSWISAVTLPGGLHGFRCGSLGQKLRNALAEELRKAGIHMSVLSRFWKDEAITTEHPTFARLFELARDPAKRQVFRFRPASSALVDRHLAEGQGAAP